MGGLIGPLLLAVSLMSACHGDIADGESMACSATPLSCSDVPEGQACPATCDDSSWAPGECVDGVGERQEFGGQMHIALPTPLNYSASPPASGDHRPMWACWGEYEFLPATRWIHNLEHGGIAFLYHPCTPEALVDELRSFVRSIEDDDAGPFRWIMTPYSGLPSAISVVAWEWVYSADCVRAPEIREFIRQHYRNAPEDVVSAGRFSEGYIGR